MSFDRLRQFVNNREKEKGSKKKGGGLKPWEREQFKLSIGESAMVRFLQIPEDSDPYVRKFHWTPNGPKTCTAEIADFGGKCVYCFYDQDHKSKQQKEMEAARSSGREHKKVASRLNAKSVTVLEVVDFRYYHIVPVPNSEDKIMVRCNVDGPEADPDRCEHCASEDDSVRAREFGGGRRWELKDDHLNQVLGAHTLMQKICVHVDDSGNVCQKETYVVELLCGSCNKPLVDSEKVRRMPAKDIEKELKKAPICPHCRHEGYPVPISACKSNAHDAVRGSVFDKNLIVHCTGETKELFGTKETYEEKIYNFDIRAEPIMSIQDSLANWGFSDEEIVKICAPQDLAWKFRPEYMDPKKYGSTDEYVLAVLENQSEALKQPNPYRSSGGGGGGFKPAARTFRRT